MPRIHFKFLLILPTLFIAACTGIPDRVIPVSDFDLDRYLGTWYEIARLDHSFERGMTHVTAEYSLRMDGGVHVINKGYIPAEGRWKSTIGKAYFVGDSTTGRLKVSFFSPFYGGYNIFALDQEHYNYVMIAGPTTSYLWILARTPSLHNAITRQLLDQANALGFDTDKIIIVDQLGQTPDNINTTR